LTDSFGWRFCFYINLPLLVLSLYVAIRVITNYNLKEQDLESTIWDRMKKIDYLGSISVVVCVVCFSLAASMGGNSRPWSDPLVLGLFIASFIMGFLFLYIEKHVAKNPLMPWSIISSRTPFASSLLNFFCMMSSFAVSYTTPLYFQGLLGYSASMSGLYILPRVIAASVGSLTAGFWISRVGEYRKLLIVSAITNVISTAGASLWGRDTSFWFISFCFTLDGWAGGCIITAALISMLSCVGSEGKTFEKILYLLQ
jgi:MFS family permease